MDLMSVAESFESWAHLDPLWAINGGSDKKGGLWDEREFFATGVIKVDEVKDHIGQLGFSPWGGRVLDFGCGVGRLSQALATHFAEVVGVDISPTMLKLAEQANRFPGRCRYELNRRPDLKRFPTGQFDCVVSIIVLQHLEPNDAKAYLREFVRVLAAGGVLVFQLISEKVSPQQQAHIPQVERESWKQENGPLIAMHPVPCAEVGSVIEAEGGRIVDRVKNRSGGPLWISYDYYVTNSGREPHSF